MEFNTLTSTTYSPSTTEYFFIALFFLCLVSDFLSLVFYDYVKKHEIQNIDVIRFCRCARFINIVAFIVFVLIGGLFSSIYVIVNVLKEPSNHEVFGVIILYLSLLCFFAGATLAGIFKWNKVLKMIGTPKENRWFV